MAEVEQATGTGPGGRWTKLASLGLTMAALGPLLWLVAGAIYGLDLGEGLPFLLPPVIVGFLGAWAVRRGATWGKVVGLVASVLVGGFMWWTVFAIVNPDSFFDFAAAVLVLPGALIGLGASIAALRARRSPAVEGQEKEAKIIRTVTVVVGALLVVSAVFTLVSKETVDESEADVTVVLEDLEFDKAQYDFDAGSTVLVRNEDPFGHTFTIEALDIDEEINPGSEVLVTIPDGASGEQTVFCRPHTSDPDAPNDDDMAADVTIN